MEDGTQHLVDLNIAETTQFRNETRALHVKEVQNNDRGSAREPNGARNAGGHGARSATGERRRLQTGVSRAGLAYAEDIVVLATSRKVVEQMILDLTEGFRDIGLEIDHVKNKLEHHTQATRPSVASGRRKNSMDRQVDIRRDYHDAELETRRLRYNTV